MNARTEPQLLAQLSNRHLDALEEETIFILREVAATFERPALLFSGGKDSLVLLRLAEKAYALGESDLPGLLRARAGAWEAETAVQRQRTAGAASASRLNQSLGVMP